MPALSPPAEPGLPEDVALGIVDAFWSSDPWLCAAMLREAYAATLPAEAAMSP